MIQAGDGDVSKHNAVAILANPDLAGDDPADELLLNNSPENDGEYNSCPNELYLDHFVDGFNNPVIDPETDHSLNPDACFDGLCPIRTYLTLVPCSQDFENQVPASVTVQFIDHERVRAELLGEHDGHLLGDDPPGRHRRADRHLH